MNIRRSTVVRLASFALLSAVFAIGAQSFSVAAYGCSQTGGSDCRSSSSNKAGDTTTESVIEQLRTLVYVFDALLP